jgi:hypothetical protein
VCEIKVYSLGRLFSIRCTSWAVSITIKS